MRRGQVSCSLVHLYRIKVCAVGRSFFKRSMWPLSVVKSDPAVDDAFGLEAVLQFVQVDSLLLEGSPEPFDEDIVRCPAVGCLQTMSIRIGQAGFSFHFRPSRSNAFAMTMSLRMTAVMASLLHCPVDINCSYLTFRSGLNRVATTAGK